MDDKLSYNQRRLLSSSGGYFPPFPGIDGSFRQESGMFRSPLLFAGLFCAWTMGCSGQPGSVEKAAANKKVATDDIGEPPAQDEPPLEESPARSHAPESSGDESKAPVEDAGLQPLELKDSAMAFQIPGTWKRVKPDTNIIEAEFELPAVDGDEFPGRLTLMSSGGSTEETLSRRTSEFKFEPGEGPARETLQVGGIESMLVDFRGEWKGPSFRPIEPRAGYRMLLVIVPFTERSAFYAKLTGPRATIAAHENEFREFLRSAQINR
jgi:hypothetical protein